MLSVVFATTNYTKLTEHFYCLTDYIVFVPPGPDDGGVGISILVVVVSSAVLCLLVLMTAILCIICNQLNKRKSAVYNLDNTTSQNSTNNEDESHEIYNILSFPEQTLNQPTTIVLLLLQRDLLLVPTTIILLWLYQLILSLRGIQENQVM